MDFGGKPQVKGARWLGIINATLPLILILGIGSNVFPPGESNASDVVGRPPSVFFAVIWSLLAVMWGAVLLISTFYTKSPLLFILFQALSLVTLGFAFGWLAANNKDPDSGTTVQVLAITTFFAALTVLAGAFTATEDVRTGLTLSMGLAPLAGWGAYATLLNMQSVNKE